jgi:hypothetical protein
MIPDTNNEYLKSQFRCPICGILFGFKNTEGDIECNVEVLRQHVKQCREGSRVKPGRIRYDDED